MLNGYLEHARELEERWRGSVRYWLRRRLARVAYAAARTPRLLFWLLVVAAGELSGTWPHGYTANDCRYEVERALGRPVEGWFERD